MITIVTVDRQFSEQQADDGEKEKGTNEQLIRNVEEVGARIPEERCKLALRINL